jgi:enoyl-CoA hydratase/carnithine racemase
VEGRVSSPAWGVESGHIKVAEQQAVAVVTLQRPGKLNALAAVMRRELAAILRHFGRGETVRGIVLTGAGRARRADQAGLARDGINRFLSRRGAADE